MEQFWRRLWKDKEDIFSEVSVRRCPNPVDGVHVPATMKVLHLPMIFSSIGDVMIRDDYGEAMRDIEGHSTSKKKSVIITGHPEIGRNMGLRLASMGSHIYSPFSRQDHVIVLHFGQTSSPAKANRSQCLFFHDDKALMLG